MDIGPEKEIIVVEPLDDPFRSPAEPTPVPAPAEPVEVPA